jgi:hypothetical protein
LKRKKFALSAKFPEQCSHFLHFDQISTLQRFLLSPNSVSAQYQGTRSEIHEHFSDFFSEVQERHAIPRRCKEHFINTSMGTRTGKIQSFNSTLTSLMHVADIEENLMMTPSVV